MVTKRRTAAEPRRSLTAKAPHKNKPSKRVVLKPVGPVKPRRYRPGTVALREIRKLIKLQIFCFARGCEARVSLGRWRCRLPGHKRVRSRSSTQLRRGV